MVTYLSIECFERRQGTFFGGIHRQDPKQACYRTTYCLSLAAINDQTDEIQAEGGALSLPSIPPRFALRFTPIMDGALNHETQ